MLAFATIAQVVDALCYRHQLPPCAQYLYRWLLRRVPGGVQQEIDLNDFDTFVAEQRGKPYCRKWTRQALYHLSEVGLVTITKRFNAREFKVIAAHPRELGSDLEDETGNKVPEL